MELLYGGEDAGFSSLRARDTQSAILNLEQGDIGDSLGTASLPRDGRGRVMDLSERKGVSTRKFRKTLSWEKRYFHMPDPDGHQLSFARPLQ